MVHLVKLQAYLTPILVAAGIGLARGDTLPVVLISSLFSGADPATSAKKQAAAPHAGMESAAADGR